jgi:hypothetical protein
MTMQPSTGHVGRNDPCPCGSGLKFKKCCINNPVALFPKHTQERRHWWSREEIAQLPTDKIIEKLLLCGIPSSQEAFLNDVGGCYGADDIYKRWKNRFTFTVKGFDADFPWMAADVLWRRLAPDKVSTEQLDDWMQDGYDLIEKRDEAGGCRLWLKVWDHLKPRFTKDMRTLKSTDSVFQGSQSLFNWCQDVEMELANAAIDDKAFHDHRIVYCREFCEYFPDENDGKDSIVRHMRQAVGESLFLSGKVEEAEREFRTLAEQHPDDPWTYIKWGDLYQRGYDAADINPFEDSGRAEALYRKALEIDPQEEETVQQRLRELKRE